ncbi:MAG: class IV adenylate cyclase [Fimbriimonadaceae bacterium]|nr:class IV adenylate cyclase [Fimbriimonadaceae bacterium]
MSDLPRLNLELKVPCTDLATARQQAVACGARPHAVQQQRDTYFVAPHGRLKLRVATGEPALLIGYHRPDTPDQRQSDYRLVPVADPDLLRATLADALGLRGEVLKEREILLWRNVRIHLDRVAGLGSFVEFEAVLRSPAELPAASTDLAALTRALGLDPTAAVAGSYVDLLGL